MKKRKCYPRTFLSAQAYEAIIREYCNLAQDDTDVSVGTLSIKNKETTWDYDTYTEFLSELRTEYTYTYIYLNNQGFSLSIESTKYSESDVTTTVTIDSSERETIFRMSNEVDRACESCIIPPPPTVAKTSEKPKIFIGHGASSCWRDLKDHLQDHHKYDVIAYETGARAGHTIRDVISEMLKQSSFAVLVMTAEDDMPDGSKRARQNVIHEIGLFQGRLGFTKAVVLKENGTEEFSNIHGVQQIRFSKGNIKETFGDVLATLKREFGSKHF
ncbi:nucleotide-binding protein [Pontiellaceae bacterium B1224]|nr:nucleotide-binding protein [Pontiellaceae bacterium B1224]